MEKDSWPHLLQPQPLWLPRFCWGLCCFQEYQALDPHLPQHHHLAGRGRDTSRDFNEATCGWTQGTEQVFHQVPYSFQTSRRREHLPCARLCWHCPQEGENQPGTSLHIACCGPGLGGEPPGRPRRGDTVAQMEEGEPTRRALRALGEHPVCQARKEAGVAEGQVGGALGI